MQTSARNAAHAGQTASRGTAANASAASASSSRRASSTRPELGVEGGQARAPQRLVALRAGDQPQDRRDLRQAALLPADGEHLQPVDAGVEGRVAGRSEDVGALGGLLGLGEPPGGQRQHHLEGMADELNAG